MPVDESHLIWIDLEMTGLFPESDVIIEIATIVTDADLNIIEEGPVIAVRQSEQTLAAMDEWNTQHHTQSGLVQRVLDSSHDIQSAQQATIDFLARHCVKGTSPMCGNSICQDRRFMVRLMPDLEAFFHYRNLDVSSIKEVIKRWQPDVLQGFSKKATHQALDDIRESIDELRYYRSTVFNI